MNYWLLRSDGSQLRGVSSVGLTNGVLSWFWRVGCVGVATSNKAPDDLHRNAVQREQLEIFVEA
jgi:predicted ATPase